MEINTKLCLAGYNKELKEISLSLLIKRKII
jgi:hypothetical protein